jgi:hypothetical protein
MVLVDVEAAAEVRRRVRDKVQRQIDVGMVGVVAADRELPGAEEMTSGTFDGANGGSAETECRYVEHPAEIIDEARRAAGAHICEVRRSTVIIDDSGICCS